MKHALFTAMMNHLAQNGYRLPDSRVIQFVAHISRRGADHINYSNEGIEVWHADNHDGDFTDLRAYVWEGKLLCVFSKGAFGKDNGAHRAALNAVCAHHPDFASAKPNVGKGKAYK